MSAMAIRHDDLPSQADWSTMLSMAEQLVKSGLLPATIKTAQAAVVIIQKGRELGIAPMAAINGIGVINGKPVCGAELMLALLYRDHGDEAVRVIRSDPDACEITYHRRGWSKPERFAFTIDDAKRAGLAGTATWTKYPAAMLRARCISAVARMAFPDSIGGMYTPEELGAAVTVAPDGDLVMAPDVSRVREIRPATQVTIDHETGEVIDGDPVTASEAVEAATPDDGQARLDMDEEDDDVEAEWVRAILDAESPERLAQIANALKESGMSSPALKDAYRRKRLAFGSTN